MKTVVICAGGPEIEITELTEFVQENSVFIGADRGALHLLKRGIVPDEAVGDFDSVTESEYLQITKAVKKTDRFKAEKDETDTELAIERSLAYDPDRVILTAVTGGRLDHMESALHLLYRLQTEHVHISFSIRNKTNEFSMLLPGEHELRKDNRFSFVSFFAFGKDVEGLTLRGFKYETLDAKLQMGTTRFTSNELDSEVCTILIREGICLMVRSSDS